MLTSMLLSAAHTLYVKPAAALLRASGLTQRLHDLKEQAIAHGCQLARSLLQELGEPRPVTPQVWPLACPAAAAACASGCCCDSLSHKILSLT